MLQHRDKRFLPYRQDLIFGMVADVDRYQEFLPWCLASRISKRGERELRGDLIVGYKALRETFSSRVLLDPPNRIDVEFLEGPFNYLKNHWVFTPSHVADLTEIDFLVEFDFNAPRLQEMFTPLFADAIKKMIAAFETRAHALFGPDAPPQAAKPRLL